METPEPLSAVPASLVSPVRCAGPHAAPTELVGSFCGHPACSAAAGKCSEVVDARSLRARPPPEAPPTAADTAARFCSLARFFFLTASGHTLIVAARKAFLAVRGELRPPAFLTTGKGRVCSK